MDIYEEILRLRQQGRKAALATIIHTQGSIPSYESSKLLIRDDGSILGTVGGGCVEAEIWAAAQEVMQQEKPRKFTFNLNADPKYDTGLTCGGTVEIFLEPILPTPVCYICGAGHVGRALARLAAPAGFSTVIVDNRPQFANRERFPDASEIYAEEWETAFEKLSPNELAYIVIVTRGHKDDMRVLHWAVQTPARYIGLIGSKRKVLSIYRELERAGIPRQQLERVHAPIGIEIGALTPEEIAISIVAEMIAVRRHALHPTRQGHAPRPAPKTIGRVQTDADPADSTDSLELKPRTSSR
ncbi:MAG: XdhC family protein [Terriglobia bacterium]